MACDFFEKTLEDIVFENRDKIHERGLPAFYRNARRQVLLPSGKKIDILTWEIDQDNNAFYARIIELKREEVTEAAFYQIAEYFWELWCALKEEYSHLFIDNILVGSSHNKNIKEILHVTDDVALYTYDYQYSGLYFKKYDFNRSYCRIVEMYPDEEDKRFANFLKEEDFKSKTHTT